MFWNIVTTECPDRSVRRLRNILTTECYVVPVLPPRRGRRTSRCARAPRQLPRRVDNELLGCARRRPLHATHPNHRIDPQGTDARREVPKGTEARRGSGAEAREFSCVWVLVSRCPRCLGRVAVGYLGVVPSGLSPRGAASFYTLGWGSGDPRWNGLQSTGSLPHTCSQPPVVPRVPSPRGVEIAFLAGSHGASSPLVALGYEHGG